MRKKRVAPDARGQPITFRPPEEIRAKMDRLTHKTGTTLTWIVLKCVEAHLPELERQAGIYRTDRNLSILNDA